MLLLLLEKNRKQRNSRKTKKSYFSSEFASQADQMVILPGRRYSNEYKSLLLRRLPPHKSSLKLHNWSALAVFSCSAIHELSQRAPAAQQFSTIIQRLINFRFRWIASNNNFPTLNDSKKYLWTRRPLVAFIHDVNVKTISTYRDWQIFSLVAFRK